MSEPRPYDERPAARPVPPAAVPGGSVPPNAKVPPKKSMGCFAIGCLGVIVVIVLAILIPVIGNAIGSASNGGDSSTTTTSGPSPGGNSGGGSGGSSDPIEQARVVLRGAYSYDTVKAATDAALAATNTPISDENYSRAWSAVLEVTDNLTGVAPMDVMACVAELGPSSGMDFPDTTAICATSIHLDG
ncbi:hypothetical protein [Microbacterium sp. LWH3-1.2]|uniref:hypothetical protein n=1 Tax=Microbacterium sp. LWH3-1.2 TaxID=3135256 RepID=UPI00341AC004